MCNETLWCTHITTVPVQHNNSPRFVLLSYKSLLNIQEP